MIYFQSQVDALLKAKNEKIELLENMREAYRERILYERNRADAAVDQVIVLSGGRPVSQPPPRRNDIAAKILEQVGLISRAGRDVGEEPKAEMK